MCIRYCKSEMSLSKRIKGLLIHLWLPSVSEVCVCVLVDTESKWISLNSACKCPWENDIWHFGPFSISHFLQVTSYITINTKLQLGICCYGLYLLCTCKKINCITCHKFKLTSCVSLNEWHGWICKMLLSYCKWMINRNTLKIKRQKSKK